MADEKSYWPIPEDLATLHDVIIEYAVRIEAIAAAKQEKAAEGPLSHSALSILHRIGIVTQRAIRSLCETGWTQVSPILIRTLLDVLASCYAIISKYEDAEFMALKFMCSYLIQAIRDPDTSDELRKHDQEQLDKIRQELKGEDIKRVNDFIANFKPPPYWFYPADIQHPGRLFLLGPVRGRDCCGRRRRRCAASRNILENVIFCRALLHPLHSSNPQIIPFEYCLVVPIA